MRHLRFHIYLLLMAAMLAGCANGTNILGSTSLAPQQAVFVAKSEYAAALTAAVAYKRLAPCPTPSKVCSDPKVVHQLQAADNAASALLDGAEATVRAGGTNSQLAITAAQQAVAAFTTITKTLGSQ